MKSGIIKIILTGFITGNSLLLTAQDMPDSRQITFKLYVNAFHQDIKNNDYHGFLGEDEIYTYKNKKYDIGTFSFAVEFGSYKKLKHEIELMPIKFDQDDIIELKTRIGEYGPITSFYNERTGSLKTVFRYQINYYFIQIGLHKTTLCLCD